EKVPKGYLLQEYIKGKACSAGLLVGDDINLLSLNSQEIEDFVYRGAKIPIKVEDLEEIFKAVDRIGGLFGYVGVDFVLNEKVWIIEINPRPTTPIVAFNEVYDINLAELILKNYYNETMTQPTARKNVHMKKVPTALSKSFIQFQGYSIVVEDTDEGIGL
ncbi:MAG: ATP-grasp domain-containing protein, partial [Candidatus Hydrothermarchaeales archaeon]